MFVGTGAVLPFGDAPVYCGLDLSAKTDLTALVIIGKVAGQWQVVPHFWTPEQGLRDRAARDRAPYDTWHRQGYLHSTPGATIDYEFVATDRRPASDGTTLWVADLYENRELQTERPLRTNSIYERLLSPYRVLLA